VAYALADASTYAFDDRFDAAISRFGVMFFDQPVAAFAHLRDAMHPGAALVFACWREVAANEWVSVPFKAATPHLPPAVPGDPEAPGPFAFADGARVTRILRDAGFAQVDVRPYDADVVLGESGVASAVHFAMTTGPTARAIRDAGEDAADRVRHALEACFADRVRDGRVTLGGAVWLVRATTPAVDAPSS
jgi:hypothetical protein